MPLFNLFNNKLNDFVDSFNKKDIISCHLSTNTTSFGLPAIQKNRAVSNFELDKRIEISNKDRLDGSSFY